MSSSRPNTVTIVAEDDDDNDICPVCDGQCTCSNNAPSFYQQESTPTRARSPAHDPPKTVLKIKLPPNFLKQKLSQPSQMASTSSTLSYSAPKPSSQVQRIPKRRGRPPKNSALRTGPGVAGPSTSAYQRPKPKSISSPNRSPQRKISSKSSTAIKDGGGRTKAIKKRKRVDSSNQSSSSELTDIDHIYMSNSNYHRSIDDDDTRSVQFPTFVSAISSNSSASSSDSDSLSGFETDSSIEAEEENFILAEERARVRRELLNGSGEESLQKRRDTNWVIRPRQMSVGASSDVDMNEDSDATEEADDDDDEDDEDEDEPDGEDTEDMSARRNGYTGLVSTWSDDEQSSLDADLFFANLSDKESGSSGSSTQSDDGEDGDYSDLEFDLSQTAASLIPHLRPGVGIGIPNLAFEVTEGWDGQVVFTNGQIEPSSRDGLQSLLEAAFLPSGPDTSPSPGPDGDVEMFSTDADGEADEEGYDQDIDQDTAEGEGDGDTTDEELVGEDDLPNERAMSLFNTPSEFNNAFSINPMSMMSPGSSPTYPSRRQSDVATEAPYPSGHLSQRMLWLMNDRGEYFEVEEEEDENSFVREQREKDRAARGGLPRTGFFEVVEEARKIVINAERKEIPSSYPRFTGRRGKSIKSMSLSMFHGGRSGGSESLLPKSSRPSSLPPLSTRSNFLTSSILPLSSSSEAPEEMIALGPSVEITSPGSASTSQEEGLITQPMSIELDDVLDASFLTAAEPRVSNAAEEPPAESSTAVNNSDAGLSTGQYIKSLNRWDVISVGALRKTGVLTDSATGWGSDSSPDYTAYSNVMKSSPLSTMLWHNRNAASRQQRSMGYILSPELGPVRDGDRTPTNGSHKRNGSPPFNTKSRKELRKERKSKRKSYGPANHHKQHLHHQHHHHPNSKNRSTSSFQRTNSFNSPVPSLSI
ncbi:hypothetical protein J3R30DRAFT_3707705 [Lentinula aciculospora]|uniref:Uncharacterized protein n=1 Tax=Lentinula aciculospora TaxID=153920 RepID=A0A9W9DKC3_9AGAR|nr:hypothetical protein J3R30DRAFT_3707705 [Lentinula aciculospora]